MIPTPCCWCFCSRPQLTGRGVAAGASRKHWFRVRGSFPLPLFFGDRGSLFRSAQPAPGELFGSVQRAIFGNLLLGAAPPREPVQVLQFTEALCHALGREPGLRVMVPALGQSLAHHLDALRWERSHRSHGHAELLVWGAPADLAPAVLAGCASPTSRLSTHEAGPATRLWNKGACAVLETCSTHPLLHRGITTGRETESRHV